MISVIPKLRLDLPSSIKANTNYAVSGQLLPKIIAIKVTVKENGKSLGEFTTDANGAFTFNIKPGAAGVSTYQVVITESGKSISGVSDEISVLVR